MRTCEEEGCDSKHLARGFCNKHYRAWRKYGDPQYRKITPRGLGLQERLQYTGWSEVTGSLETPCWEWKGARNSGGYGKFQLRGQEWIASRAAYEATYGEIPSGLLVRHKCDNPPCVNPEHLEVGTYQDNRDDQILRNRRHYRPHRARMAKLSWDDVQQARKQRDAGDTLETIARRFGVDRSTIGYVVRGDTWKTL